MICICIVGVDVHVLTVLMFRVLVLDVVGVIVVIACGASCYR